MGIINPYAKFFTSYIPIRPSPGSIGITSQSGNLGGQFMREAQKDDIGVRSFCGSGNEAMITIEDYLGAFEVDDLTRTVVLYIESLKNGGDDFCSWPIAFPGRNQLYCSRAERLRRETPQRQATLGPLLRTYGYSMGH